MASEWTLSTLGEVATWLSGGTPSKSVRDFWNGEIPWISASSMTQLFLGDSEEKVTELGVGHGTRLVDAGVVLLLVRGSALHTRIPLGITTRRVAFNQDVKALVPKHQIDGRFLLYCVLANYDELLHMVEFTGIGAGKLDTGRLQNLTVPVPPLAEQRAIAAILSALDDKIELNRRMNHTLEQITRAMFQSWFVDFDPVWAKKEGRRPAGMDAETAALLPDDFEESELGPIPKGWSVHKLGDLVSTQYGVTASSKQNSGGFKLLRVMDINKQEWIGWDTVPGCELSEEQIEKYRLRVGDIVVARMADPGKSALIEEQVDAVFASYLVRLVARRLDMAYYIAGFLKSTPYLEYVNEVRTGSVQLHMNATVITDVHVCVPPREITERYYRTVVEFRKLLVANVKGSQTLATIRDTLLPKLVSGEISIRGVDK